MDDVLELYERPHDPAEPVVCLDEKPCQLTADVRPAVPAAPGIVAKQDYEYERRGTCCVFVAVEPQGKRRRVWVRKQRKKADFARVVRDLLHGCPQARRVHPVVDNLDTHGPHSLIETFGERRAAPLLKRLEFHYTPKHAGWLKMSEIEIEIGALDRRCLARRLESLEVVDCEIRRWSRTRNRRRCGMDWTFRRADARRVFSDRYKRKLTRSSAPSWRRIRVSPPCWCPS